MKHLEYKTQGTCSASIHLDVDDDNTIRDVKFLGGCNGNLQGIARLVVGMKADFVIERLKGTTCGRKGTSCPDQLAMALEQIVKERA